jgi:hypothetical protein
LTDEELHEELLDRAKRLAKETGRSVSDVLADLEDDGVLNNSNNRGDLITQLQEAAELIDTVQAINRKVSENTVLNGGSNKTDVKVDTTLEGDIVDRAIASAHRKVVELKKIALIIAPVFLLISGGTLEGLGVINLFGSDSDDEDEYDYSYEYGGCLDPAAQNYDSFATWDDGSCWYDNGGHGGDCHPDFQLHMSDWNIDNTKATVHIFLYDNNVCDRQYSGSIHVQINKDGVYYDEEWLPVDWTQDTEHWVDFDDLETGTYDAEATWHIDESSWHWNLDGQYEVGCGTQPFAKSSRIEANSDQDLEVFMLIGVNNNDPACSTDVEVMLALYLEDSFQFTVDYDELPTFDIDKEREIKVIHPKMQNLESGNWSAETRFYYEDAGEVCCEYTDSVQIVRD